MTGALVGDFKEKFFCKQSKSETKLTLYVYTPKIAIIFGESMAIMALDHSRVDLENKFFPNK